MTEKIQLFELWKLPFFSEDQKISVLWKCLKSNDDYIRAAAIVKIHLLESVPMQRIMLNWILNNERNKRNKDLARDWLEKLKS